MADLDSIYAITVPAATPVKLSDFQGGRVKVCFAAAGEYTVEAAPASEDDKCLPGDFAPYTVVDLCGDGKTETDLVLSVLEDDAPCCFTLDPCADFVQFSGDATVSGFYAERRKVVNHGTGPTTNPADNLPA